MGAYILTKVYDPESSLPDKMVPEYVSVTNAFKDGLPYDFDQVRVFTWNVKKHRYETAYRQRNLEGYLPVQVSQSKNAQGQPVPEFSITVATSDAVKVDPLTGAARPAQTAVLRYQLEGGMVKRVRGRRPDSGARKIKPNRPRHVSASPSRQGEKGGRVSTLSDRVSQLVRVPARMTNLAQEIGNRGHHDFLLLECELGEDGQRQDLRCGTLTLRERLPRDIPSSATPVADGEPGDSKSLIRPLARGEIPSLGRGGAPE